MALHLFLGICTDEGERLIRDVVFVVSLVSAVTNGCRLVIAAAATVFITDAEISLLRPRIHSGRGRTDFQSQAQQHDATHEPHLRHVSRLQDDLAQCVFRGIALPAAARARARARRRSCERVSMSTYPPATYSSRMRLNGPCPRHSRTTPSANRTSFASVQASGHGDLARSSPAGTYPTPAPARAHAAQPRSRRRSCERVPSF